MKNFVDSLLRTTRTEMMKSRKTMAFWLCILYPLFAVSLVSLSVFGIDFGDTNPWTRFIHNLGNVAAFFLPFYIILLIGFYGNLEHKSNTWKHLLSQPVPKLSLYLGKLMMIVFLLVLSLALFMAFSGLAVFLLNLASAKFSLAENKPDLLTLWHLLLRNYLAASIIIALQYWLSLRIRNLIWPIVTGIGLIILPIAVAIIMGMAGFTEKLKLLEKFFMYDPYSYPFTHIFNFMKVADKAVVILPELSQLYLGIALVLLSLGYFDFSRRNVK